MNWPAPESLPTGPSGRLQTTGERDPTSFTSGTSKGRAWRAPEVLRQILLCVVGSCTAAQTLWPGLTPTVSQLEG